MARMIRKQLKRRPRSTGAQAAGRRTLASGVIALVAMVFVGGAAFARPAGPGDSSVSPPELTESEGYHHLLAEKRESVASRAEDFVNNYYGFGDAGDEDNDPRLTADAARWQGQADAYFARQKAIQGQSVASRAEDFVNNYYGFGDAGETDGTKVAHVAPDSPVASSEQGLSTEAVAITFFSLLLLVTGVTIMIVRRGNYRPAS